MCSGRAGEVPWTGDFSWVAHCGFEFLSLTFQAQRWESLWLPTPPMCETNLWRSRWLGAKHRTEPWAPLKDLSPSTYCAIQYYHAHFLIDFPGDSAMIITMRNVKKINRCGTLWYVLMDMVVFSQSWDFVIMEIFYKLSDSMILQYCYFKIFLHITDCWFPAQAFLASLGITTSLFGLQLATLDVWIYYLARKKKLPHKLFVGSSWIFGDFWSVLQHSVLKFHLASLRTKNNIFLAIFFSLSVIIQEWDYVRGAMLWEGLRAGGKWTGAKKHCRVMT